MPDIHIERNHTLGLPAARTLARQWMRRVEQDYGVQFRYAEGDACDVAQFGRTGIDGSVEVSGVIFRLSATLAFPFGNFSEQIEQRLRQNLDALLGTGEQDDDDYNDKAWL